MADMLKRPWLEVQLLKVLKEATSTRMPFKAAGYLQARVFHNYRFEKGHPKHDPDELISADVSDKFCVIRCNFTREVEDRIQKQKGWRLTQLKSGILAKASGYLCIVEDTASSSLNCVFEIHSFTPLGDLCGAIFGEPADFNRLTEARRLLNSHHVMRMIRPQLPEIDEIRSQVSQASSDSDIGDDSATFATQLKHQEQPQSISSVPRKRPSVEEAVGESPDRRLAQAKQPKMVTPRQEKLSRSDSFNRTTTTRKRLHTGWGDFQDLTYYDCQIPAAQQKVLDSEECWMPKGEYAIEPIVHRSRKAQAQDTTAKRQRQIQFPEHTTTHKTSLEITVATCIDQEVELVETQGEVEEDAMSWAASPERKADSEVRFSAYLSEGAPNSPPPDSSPLQAGSPIVPRTLEKPFIPPALHEPVGPDSSVRHLSMTVLSPVDMEENELEVTVASDQDKVELGSEKVDVAFEERISQQPEVSEPPATAHNMSPLDDRDTQDGRRQLKQVLGTPADLAKPLKADNELLDTINDHAFVNSDLSSPQSHPDATTTASRSLDILSQQVIQHAVVIHDEPDSEVVQAEQDIEVVQAVQESIQNDQSKTPPPNAATASAEIAALTPPLDEQPKVRETIFDTPILSNAAATPIEDSEAQKKPSRRIPWQVQTSSITDKKLEHDTQSTHEEDVRTQNSTSQKIYGIAAGSVKEEKLRNITQSSQDGDVRSQRSVYQNLYDIAARRTTPSSLDSTPNALRIRQDRALPRAPESAKISHSQSEGSQAGPPRHTKWPYNFSSPKTSQSDPVIPQTQNKSVESSTAKPGSSPPASSGFKAPECLEQETLPVPDSYEEQDLEDIQGHDAQNTTEDRLDSVIEFTTIDEPILIESSPERSLPPSSPVLRSAPRPSAQIKSPPAATPARVNLQEDVGQRSSAHSRRTSKVLRFNFNDLRSEDDGMDVKDILQQDRERFMRLRLPPPDPLNIMNRPVNAVIPVRPISPFQVPSRKRKAEEMMGEYVTPEVLQTSSVDPSVDEEMEQTFEEEEEELQPWQAEIPSEAAVYEEEEEEEEEEDDEEEDDDDDDEEAIDNSSVEGLDDTPLREFLHTTFRVRNPRSRRWDVLSWETRLRALDRRQFISR